MRSGMCFLFGRPELMVLLKKIDEEISSSGRAFGFNRNCSECLSRPGVTNQLTSPRPRWFHVPFSAHVNAGANLRAVSSPFEVWIWFTDYAIMGSTGPALPEYKLALVLFFHTQQDKTWELGFECTTCSQYMAGTITMLRVPILSISPKHATKTQKCAVLRWDIVEHDNRSVGNRVYMSPSIPVTYSSSNMCWRQLKGEGKQQRKKYQIGKYQVFLHC